MLIRRVSIQKLCVALVVAFLLGASSPRVASALTATSTSIAASPNPVVEGQPSTLTATPSVPGTVTFSIGGQTVGTGIATGTGAAVPATQRWDYTGNSIATSSAVDSNGNVYVATYNGDDCSGSRCGTKQLTPGGGINYFANQGWNGSGVFITGLAVTPGGIIYESVGTGNKIYKRTGYNQSTTEFVNTGLSRPCGLTLDSSDNLYVANKDSGVIQKITPAGVVSTYASGLTSPCGVVMNKTTGTLYVADGDGDIRTISSGGGSATLLVSAACNTNWWGGSQLAIDEAGYLYGRYCDGSSIVTQISPTGTMTGYLTTGGSTTPSASQNSPFDVTYFNGSIYVAGAEMGTSSTFRFGASSYRATLVYTPTQAGSLSIDANLVPAESSSYATSSASGTLTVTPAAPQTPDLAAGSDLGTLSTDNLTSDNSPLIEVPGTYAVGDTITVTASKSGSANVSCTYVVPDTGCSLGTLADGTWSIAATDTNPTSGASAASGALSISVDTSGPNAPAAVDLAASSDTGSLSTDNITSDTTPTVSASGGSNGDTMTITATNGSSTWSCSYVIGVESNCVLPALTDGNWNVSATLTDPAGNVSVASSALPLTIDATAAAGLTPDLAPASDSGESSTDNITSDNTPTFSVPGQVAGDVVTITASKSGSADVACTYTVGAATSCDLGSLVDGDWTISGSIVDSAGNAGLTNSLALTIDTAAPAAPAAPDLVEASDSGSSSTDNATSDNTPTLSGGVAANGTLVTITASKNGSPSVSCSYVASPSVSTCDLGTLSDGTWTVGTSMTDPAGNVSQAGASLSIAIDTAAPAAPSTPQSTGPESGRVTVPNVPSGSVVVISGQSGGLSITCTYVAGTQSNCLLQPLAPGLWNLTASITDEAGNASASSGSLALDVVDVVDEVSAGEGEGTGADAGAGGAQLPSTGSSSLALMLWALTFLALGTVLWQMSTRRKLS